MSRNYKLHKPDAAYFVSFEEVLRLIMPMKKDKLMML